MSPIILLIFSYGSKKKIIEKNQKFYSKWGALYEEFNNNKGFISTQFYFLFMIRRMLYALSQVFLNSIPGTQNTLNIFGTLATIIYVLRYQNYREKKVLICGIIGEIAVIVTMILSLIFFFNLTDDS